MGLFSLLISTRVSRNNIIFLKEKILNYLLEECDLHLLTELYRWTFSINDEASAVVSIIKDFTQELFVKKVNAIFNKKDTEEFVLYLNLCLQKHFVDITATIRKTICSFIIENRKNRHNFFIRSNQTFFPSFHRYREKRTLCECDQ